MTSTIEIFYDGLSPSLLIGYKYRWLEDNEDILKWSPSGFPRRGERVVNLILSVRRMVISKR